MVKALLKETADAMVAPGKGILAIDESTPTCNKRFKSIGVESSEENRRKYRQLLVTAPGAEEFISGYILFDETLRQKTDDGTLFPELLKSKGIMPGIKVDMGAKDLALHEGEKITEGLDGLRERYAEYKELGARFAKWRAVIKIGDGLPSKACIKANAHALARYAALAQEAGMVPMVEPEVLMDGPHSVEDHYDTTAWILKTLFAELEEQEVYLEGTILKVNMILSGTEHAEQADAMKVAEMTVKCLKENVPENLAGVVFLSGGQSDEDATVHLNEMNKIGGTPWPLSFSYGRAIQSTALTAWGKDQNNIERAQGNLTQRAKCNSEATKGEYAGA